MEVREAGQLRQRPKVGIATAFLAGGTEALGRKPWGEAEWVENR